MIRVIITSESRKQHRVKNGGEPKESFHRQGSEDSIFQTRDDQKDHNQELIKAGRRKTERAESNL